VNHGQRTRRVRCLNIAFFQAISAER
jgi:hypothetical protein